MKLQLVEHRRSPRENKYAWLPYGESPEFEYSWWTGRSWYLYDDPWCWQVFIGEAEVARVELDDDAGINPEYENVPQPSPDLLEFQFIEVAESRRGEGIGKATVTAFQERFPDRRFMAYSEQADEFWASLGWTRYDHPEGSKFHRPLFIQPAS